MCSCLLLLVGSMWINSQTGGWLNGPCQNVSVNPDKATDMSQTEKCFPSLDSRYVLAPSSEALENIQGQLPWKKYLSRREKWATQADSLRPTTHLGPRAADLAARATSWWSGKAKGFKTLHFSAFSTQFLHCPSSLGFGSGNKLSDAP